MLDIFSWAKQLIFQFDEFALRIHLFLHGSFKATVSKKIVMGDYQRTYNPRLVLNFKSGEIKMFGCSVKFIECVNTRSLYDFSPDIMTGERDAAAAIKRIMKCPNDQIANVLKDQEGFDYASDDELTIIWASM